MLEYPISTEVRAVAVTDDCDVDPTEIKQLEDEIRNLKSALRIVNWRISNLERAVGKHFRLLLDKLTRSRMDFLKYQDEIRALELELGLITEEEINEQDEALSDRLYQEEEVHDLSKSERKLIKTLYHRIAHKTHPDSAGFRSEYSDLFHRATKAYQLKDLSVVQAIYDILFNARSDLLKNLDTRYLKLVAESESLQTEYNSLIKTKDYADALSFLRDPTAFLRDFGKEAMELSSLAETQNSLMCQRIAQLKAQINGQESVQCIYAFKVLSAGYSPKESFKPESDSGSSGDPSFNDVDFRWLDY
jgi:hypothetical protein